MSSKNNKDRKSAQIIDPGLGELNKVRDILFGRDIEQVDQRFADLEESLVVKMASIQKTIESQMASIEEKMNQQVASLQESLKTEASERESHIDETHKSMTSALQSSQQLLTESINKAEDLAQQDLMEYRSQAEKQQKATDANVAENIDQLRDEMTKLLSQQADALQDRKLDREGLALMFDEITVKLRKDRN